MEHEQHHEHTGVVDEMCHAVIHERMDILESLINIHECCVNCRSSHIIFDSDGGGLLSSDQGTVLCCAAEFGKFQMVRLLVEDCGAQVDIADENGYTPLHLAVYNGHVDIVQYLLSVGANANAVTTSSNVTPLYDACESGYIECVRVLMNSNSDVSIASNLGWSPLHVAVDFNRTQCVQFLLDHPQTIKEHVDAMTDDGRTPLMLAVANDYFECVELLLRHNARFYTVMNIDTSSRVTRALVAEDHKRKRDRWMAFLLLFELGSESEPRRGRYQFSSHTLFDPNLLTLIYEFDCNE